MWKEAVVV